MGMIAKSHRFERNATYRLPQARYQSVGTPRRIELVLAERGVHRNPADRHG